MPFNLSGSKASFALSKSGPAEVRIKVRATFRPSVVGYTDPMLALGLEYLGALEGAVQIVPAGGIAWEATDVDWAVVSPVAVGSTPFEVELVWGPAGATVSVNGGAVIALETLAAPPATGNIRVTISSGAGSGSGGPLGTVDWVALSMGEAVVPPFWTEFRNTFEVP